MVSAALLLAACGDDVAAGGGGTAGGAGAGGMSGTTGMDAGDAAFPGDATSDGHPSSDASGMSCNPLRQNCPAGEKCAFTLPPNTIDPVDVCRVDGSIPVGGACTTPTSTVGIDDCVRGSICFTFHVAPGNGVCRAFCSMDSDCGPSERCGVNLTGTLGVCLPQCTLTAGSCPSGTSCKHDYGFTPTGGYSNFLTCEPSGIIPAGEACVSDLECAPFQTCLPWAFGIGTCAPLCYSGGCGGAGQTCTIYQGSNPAFGYCGCGSNAACPAGSLCMFPWLTCVDECQLGVTACRAGTSCNLTLDITRNFTLSCQTAGTTPTGGACNFNADCAPQNACLYYAASAGYRCTKLCTGAGQCPSGQSCQPLSGSNPPFGACQ